MRILSHPILYLISFMANLAMSIKMLGFRPAGDTLNKAMYRPELVGRGTNNIYRDSQPPTGLSGLHPPLVLSANPLPRAIGVGGGEGACPVGRVGGR